MNKIIIKLCVPFLEEEYDIKIPVFLTVGEIITLLTRSITTLSAGRFHASGNEVLCLKGRDLLLDYHHQISEYGIQNGDQLVLI